MTRRWRISCDVGGTFTDCIGIGPDGRRHRRKVLSSQSPPSPITAARLVTGTAEGQPLPPMEMRLGTTAGTNALLEGKLTPTAAFFTDGFADLLRIGDQRRDDLFAWHPTRATLPLRMAVGIPGRLDATGTEVTALDESALRRRAAEARAIGCESAAVAFLHSWISPEHERRAAAILHEVGFAHVSVSSQLGRVIGYERRARAACVDALLWRPVGDFLRTVRAGLGADSELLVMTSAGGLERDADFRPKDSLLSGPAGGALGALHAARAANALPAIGLDMGGTSADVCRLGEHIEFRSETSVGAATIASPSVAIESVASGGGSICWFDGQSLRVGPQSAGASPGPACYGRGGPMTLTDAHVLLGRIGEMAIPIDRSASAAAAALLQSEVEARRGPLSRDALLHSLIDIANEQMAQAIRAVSVRRGFDPGEHTLVAFGGAGGLHATEMAQLLGMSRVLIPPDAGLLSALGISLTRHERVAEATVQQRLDESINLAGLIRNAAQACGPGAITRVSVLVRLEGQDEPLEVEVGAADAGWQDIAVIRSRFERAYESTYGYAPPQRAAELEGLRVAVAIDSPAAEPNHGQSGDSESDLPTSTYYLGSGWERAQLPSGAVLLTRGQQAAQVATASDEVRSSRMMSIAADMGHALRRTAVSVNVKHRLDYSCAILDANGNLVANAPHLPVHLGALGVCTRLVSAALSPRPGDVLLTNHPAFGGSHLPDLTVITPIFETDTGGQLLGFAANRAHHAEIGGSRPGSMPPAATTLIEEGVVIAPLRIAHNGQLHLDRIETLLRGGRYPSRSPAENLADIRAQIAANALAVRRLREESNGDPVRLQHDFTRMRSQAAERCCRVIASLGAGPFAAKQQLDDGTPIKLSISTVCGETPRLHISFAGSGAVHPRSFNAPSSVVRSAVMYALRLMAGRLLPDEAPWMALNEGFLDPVELDIPEGLLNPPFTGPPETLCAVAAGNVETSQRVVDTLLLAFGLAASSQGTMNNLLFGDATLGYYETICGGAGATPAGDGLAAVHTHMTNTRITDAEVLERRYPVRLECFEVRSHSGGDGANRGGDGARRSLRFLRPLSVSLLSQHRARGPDGLAGGSPGQPGQQRVARANGTIEPIPGCAAFEAGAGDSLTIETPGGGGWGKPPTAS